MKIIYIVHNVLIHLFKLLKKKKKKKDGSLLFN